MTVAELIRVWIADAGLSQNKLAAMIGSTQSQVCKWCNGKATPRGDMILRIIDVCGLEVRRKDRRC